MRLIDVDSHFLEPPDWLQSIDPKLAAEIPPGDPIERIVQGVVGDLLDIVPRSQRPENLIELLAPSGKRALAALLAENAEIRDAKLAGPPGSYDASERIALLDQHGIDVQFLNSTLGTGPYAAAMKIGRPDLAKRALSAYNRWTAETLAGHTGRLIPTTLVDLVDVDHAIAEMTRMRRAGSRAIQVRAEPVSSTKSLAHPDHERVWSAAEDLGMAVIFHIAGGRAEIKRGWYFNGGDPGNFALLHLINSPVVPQLALAALLFEGVFERHPRLVVMVQELGISWLPHFLELIDATTVGRWGEQFGMGPGDWKYPLKPSEYLERQLRVSVLAAGEALRPTLDRVPTGMLLYSSDFPHQEGRWESRQIFEDQMDGIDAEARELFFGKSISDLMAL
jgi:predicted TIM-barrel fold metal-dependent hydrolase